MAKGWEGPQLHIAWCAHCSATLADSGWRTEDGSYISCYHDHHIHRRGWEETRWKGILGKLEVNKMMLTLRNKQIRLCAF